MMLCSIMRRNHRRHDEDDVVVVVVEILSTQLLCSSVLYYGLTKPLTVVSKSKFKLYILSYRQRRNRRRD